MLVENLIKSGTATIVDVRTPEEFEFGHVKNSINIPLQIIETKFEELKQLNKNPIVLCCASGNRSGMATSLLQRYGFENVYNAGSWIYVNNLLK